MPGIDPRELTPVAPEFYVPSVEDAVRFYTEKLGFTVIRDESPGFAVLTLNEAIVMFAHVGAIADTPALIRGGALEIRIMVPDVDAMHQRTLDSGVQIERAIGDRDYGLRDFIVRDPNGFRLRFASPL